jgi:hypothetical protein
VTALRERWLIALDTEMIMRSGADRILDEVLAGMPGPKRWLTSLGFLVVFRLVIRSKTFQIQDLADVYLALPDEVRHRFGTPPDAAERLRRGRSSRLDETVVLEQFRHLWRVLSYRLDDSPVTRPYPEPDARERIYQLRIRLCDALGSAWVVVFEHDVHVQDGTAIDGYSNKKQGGDPTLREGHRTPTRRDPREDVFGGTLVAIIGARSFTAAQPPLVILHHELVPANHPEGLATIRLYQRHAQHCALNWVVGDPLISFVPKSFSEEIVRLGGRPVHELHQGLKLRAGKTPKQMYGFDVYDSWLWHPALPVSRRVLNYTADNIDHGIVRGRHAAQLLTEPTPDRLEVRAGCSGRPYPGHQPTLVCPAYPQASPSPAAPVLKQCLEAELCQAPDGVWIPLIARGRPSVIGRGYQPLPRLSEIWWDIYPPVRSYIENVWSTITTTNGANLAERTHTIQGLPMLALWVAHGVAIHNHQRIWRALRNPRSTQLNDAERNRLRDDILFASRAELLDHYRRLFPAA